MSQNRYEAAVARYFEAWNSATDAEARAKAVAAAWVEDGTYTDPLAQVAGHEGIGAL
ncbi:nuclear transport factor 2 family protein, partial [Streptomyces sp. PA03-6a]|nr:nuclear transport factor 2 family protein [Streptomyces sp. PA03-6a]